MEENTFIGGDCVGERKLSNIHLGVAVLGLPGSWQENKVSPLNVLLWERLTRLSIVTYCLTVEFIIVVWKKIYIWEIKCTFFSQEIAGGGPQSVVHSGLAAGGAWENMTPWKFKLKRIVVVQDCLGWELLNRWLWSCGYCQGLRRHNGKPMKSGINMSGISCIFFPCEITGAGPLSVIQSGLAGGQLWEDMINKKN